MGGGLGGDFGVGCYGVVGHEAAACEQPASPGSKGGNKARAGRGAEED